MPSKYGFETREDRLAWSKERFKWVVKHTDTIKNVIKDYMTAYYPDAEDLNIQVPDPHAGPNEIKFHVWQGRIRSESYGPIPGVTGVTIALENDPSKFSRFKWVVNVIDQKLNDEECQHRQYLVHGALENLLPIDSSGRTPGT